MTLADRLAALSDISLLAISKQIYISMEMASVNSDTSVYQHMTKKEYTSFCSYY